MRTAEPGPQPHCADLPMRPTTTLARATHDYQRNGTCDLFAAFEIVTGTVITDIRPGHTSDDFIAFLNKIDRRESGDDPPRSPTGSSTTLRSGRTGHRNGLSKRT